MRRREVITLLGGAAAWPLAARAQQGPRNKQVRIGFLAAAVPAPAMLSAFPDALRERGYVEGQNLSIANRWPQGALEQISEVAAELVRSNADIIVAWTTPAALAAKAATATIPIVTAGIGDPVDAGVVRRLAACCHRAQSQQSSRDLRAAGSRECRLDTGARRRRRSKCGDRIPLG